jgi:uncharacterized coiled-coil protein SlyX
MLAELPKTETILAVASFLGSAAFVVFVAGRWSSKMETHKEDVKKDLNGFGTRVSNIEMSHKHEEGRVDALEVQMSRTQGQYEALIRILGEAKGSVDQFREGMRVSGEKIEKKIEALTTQQADTKLEISQRLTAVETSLQHLESRS